MSLPEIGPTVTPQDRAAAALFESAIELCHEANVPVSVLAPHVEAEIKSAYGIETSAPLPVILRALQAWKPSTALNASSQLLRLTSRECPIRDAAERDPEQCRTCRTMQRELLARAVNVDPGAIEIPRTIVEGDGECEVRIHLARPPP